MASSPEPAAALARMSPYRRRRTRSMGRADVAGWTLKLIGIGADALPGRAEIDAALAAAARDLPRPARTPARSAVGFVIVHRGTEALWTLVCWWELDILYERLWRADPGTTALRPVPPDGPTACVWELDAIEHERRAWIEYVLRRPAAPDLPGYLAAGYPTEEETA